ncbi:GntR family transcriptional regulator [Cellulomonas sp. HZM]|uniref:GntR family transcriptional regulator n=1 Tax=Cellulomonas sp. HZM TaxID=1454010 RepID=UPI000A6EDF74|nr:GntR family transcriptional regulator [Cellulomonas sp. HZM]
MEHELQDAHAAHKYLTVRDHLARMVAQELSVGDAIPSERALTQQFGLSRMTVRQAVDALVTEGVLVREQGRGTFVAPQRMDFEMRLTTFGEEMRRRGLEPGTEILAARTVGATPDVAAALEIEPDDEVHFLYRVRSADDVPICIEQAWIPASLAPALFDDGAPTSVYERLREQGLAPEWGEDTLSAGDATDAEAGLLGLTRSRAVLRAERRTYAAAGAVMFSRACYRPDRYTVWVPLRAPRPALVPRRRAADEAAPHDDAHHDDRDAQPAPAETDDQPAPAPLAPGAAVTTGGGRR